MDRALLGKMSGGLKEKLVSIRKKGIADGGYAGEPKMLSTPNGHDLPSVQKFESRALKRHEKFNSMLKCFKCLLLKFWHTAYKPNQLEDVDDEDSTKEESVDVARLRYKACFGAVAVLCQYRLKNGQPLYNIYVGEM